MTHPKVTLLSEPAYDVFLHYEEPAPGCLMPFVHLDVYQPSPSVIKALLSVWPSLRATLPPIIFCHGAVDDAKFHRFVTRFGWNHLSHTPCTDGITRRIYVNYL